MHRCFGVLKIRRGLACPKSGPREDRILVILSFVIVAVLEAPRIHEI